METRPSDQARARSYGEVSDDLLDRTIKGYRLMIQLAVGARPPTNPVAEQLTHILDELELVKAER